MTDVLRHYGWKTAAFYPPAVFYVEGQKLKAYADSHFDFEYVKVEYLDAAKRVDQMRAYYDGVNPGQSFVWVHFFEPHEPYVGHPEHPFGPGDMDRYDSEIAYADAAVGKLVAAVRPGVPGPSSSSPPIMAKSSTSTAAGTTARRCSRNSFASRSFSPFPGRRRTWWTVRRSSSTWPPRSSTCSTSRCRPACGGRTSGPGWPAPPRRPPDCRRRSPSSRTSGWWRRVRTSCFAICAAASAPITTWRPTRTKRTTWPTDGRSGRRRCVGCSTAGWTPRCGSSRWPEARRATAVARCRTPIERGRLGNAAAAPELAALLGASEAPLLERREAGELLVALPPQPGTAPLLARAAGDRDPTIADWVAIARFRLGEAAAKPRVRDRRRPGARPGPGPRASGPRSRRGRRRQRCRCPRRKPSTGRMTSRCEGQSWSRSESSATGGRSPSSSAISPRC